MNNDNFWESELGEITGSEKDSFAKNFTIIPDGTRILSKIDSFSIVEKEGLKTYVVEWVALDGEFKGRKVRLSLKVYGGGSYDKEPEKTRHRALNMFKLLYQLFQIKPKSSSAPTDQDLLPFVGKTAGIVVRETPPNNEGKQYNWVSEVHSSQGFKSETGKGLIVVNKSSQSSGNVDSAFSRYDNYEKSMQNPDANDDIPF